MKIAIITQPLMYNYGGLLQNYALQQVLIQLGHTPITFDQIDWVAPIHSRIANRIKKTLRLSHSTISPYSNVEQFTNKYIIHTRKVYSYQHFRKLDKKYKPDAYIVGSDQVWRPRYNLFLYANFLNFTSCHNKVAYAASFGTDEWEFNPDMTAFCKDLLKQFSYVSVRERSAVELCKQYFNRDVDLVLDPTMLLNASEYTKLTTPRTLANNYIFTYILDSSTEKQLLITRLLEDSNMLEYAAGYNHLGEKTMPISVEDWISGIIHANIIVCDSFHGVVFSILYKKNFWVLNNYNRGNTRLRSLLEVFDLEDRLVINYNEINNTPINWGRITDKLNLLRKYSFDFLRKALDK